MAGLNAKEQQKPGFPLATDQIQDGFHWAGIAGGTLGHIGHGGSWSELSVSYAAGRTLRQKGALEVEYALPLFVTITYFDAAMVVMEIGGIRLLTDPVLDPNGTTFDYGPIRLRKTSDPMATEAALGRIDAVLLSHDQHADNLDLAGRAFLGRVPLVLTTPLAASRLGGVAVRGLSPWERFSIEIGTGRGPLKVTAVPAQHGPDGTENATRPVTGFVLEHAEAERPVYVSGNTVPFAGTDEIADRYAPLGLALLHLGRVRLAPMGDLSFSMSAADAVAYAKRLQARCVVPIHFEGGSISMRAVAPPAGHSLRPPLRTCVGCNPGS